MENQNTNISARIITGLILIALGGLFLLDNYGILSFSIPDFLFRWQYILIAIGLFILATSNNKTAAAILIGIGLLNLFPEFWPLLLVALGMYIILRRNNPKKHSKISNDNSENPNFIGSENKSANLGNDTIDDVSIFGGGNKTFVSKNFMGGKLTAIFGGAELHLENCELAQGRNELDLFVMFGGYTAYVPQDWHIVYDIVPLFGGFSDKRIKDPNRVYEENKVLVVKGLVIFGGGEIK